LEKFRLAEATPAVIGRPASRMKNDQPVCDDSFCRRLPEKSIGRTKELEHLLGLKMSQDEAIN
jgi:hypothetical protein